MKKCGRHRRTSGVLEPCLIAAVWTATCLQAAEPRINIVFPAAGASVSTDRQTYVIGSVTPADTPITVNSQTVTPWRTGGFLFMAPVARGTNTLAIQAGTTKHVHTFTVPFPSLSLNANPLRVQHPVQPLGVYTGEAVRLACRAPSGHSVFAAVGERTIPLSPRANDPSLYEGTVVFAGPVERVPVTFFSEGLADSSGASLTARPIWPALRVTGPLLETRARSEPGDGDTIAFLTPDLHVQGAGFCGPHTRFWLQGKMRYVAAEHVSEEVAAKTLPPRELNPPDMSLGLGPHPPTNRLPSQILIVLDPGHGGRSTGALGPTGLTEKCANLQQALYAKAALQEAGFRVLLTREADVDLDLYERARLAYRERADAFISFHHNATIPSSDPRGARHVSTYAWNERGLELAKAIHPHVAAVTPIADRGVMQASFAVCRNPAVPSCLLELDFINCPEGEESIQNPAQQRRVAEAIRAGLEDWLKGPKP